LLLQPLDQNGALVNSTRRQDLLIAQFVQLTKNVKITTWNLRIVLMTERNSKQELQQMLKEMKLFRLPLPTQLDLGQERRDATQQLVLKMRTILTTFGLRMTCPTGLLMIAV
jgi:predicted RNase H-related nuclease YkuK (DUF458 family)